MIETFKQNLRSIYAIAKRNGIKVLFANQPLQTSEEYFVRHVALKPFNDIVVYPLHDEFVQHHRKLNDAMRLLAEETQCYFLDNDSKFGDNEEYFIDYVHYTTKGVRLLARNYKNFIINSNIIKLSEDLK